MKKTVRVWWKCLSAKSAIVCGVLMMSGIVSLNAIAQTKPAPAVRAQHGDWQIVCRKPAGAKNEACAAVQDVTSESNPNVGLSVHFQRASDGSRALRVFAPLGVLLPPGLGLQIDKAKVGHAPFVRCHVIGCFAQVTLDNTLMEKFQAGKTAWFIVFQTKEAGIGIPVSLNGLAEAMDGLK
ncbi:MAG: invasion associated locus B family protein [Hyphomicrobiaceae bacterium]